MATVINKRDVALQAASPRTVTVNLGSSVNVNGTVSGNVTGTLDGTAVATVVSAAMSATANYFTTSASNPSGGANGDAHYNSSTNVMWFKISGTWTQGGTINADAITAGTLAAARIAASSITADKLNVSSLSAVSANLGTVTAGSITSSSSIDISGKGVFGGAYSSGGYTAALHANMGSASQYGVVALAGTSGIAIVGVAGSGDTAAIQGTSGVSGVPGIQAINTGGGTALAITGAMTINNTTLVSNLNADLLDGLNSTAFATAASGVAAYTSDRLGGYADTSWVRIIATDSGSTNASGSGFQLNVTVSGIRTRAAGGNQVVIENIPSDRRLKKNIKADYLGLDFMNAIKPVTFEWKNEDGSYSKKVQHGVIAQDLAGHLIDNDMMISVDHDGYYHVDYNSLLSPIINSIKELNKKIEVLKNGKS